MLRFFRRNRSAASLPDPRNFVAVGYPKVGNTWLRFMLGRYLQRLYGLPEMPLMDKGDFLQLQTAGVPAIGDFTHDPLVWDHQTYDDLTPENVVTPYRHLKVLLLVRYPLDAIASHHAQRVNRTHQSGTLTDMISDPVLGLEKFIRFYRLWYENRDNVKSLKVWRYEDAHLNTCDLMRDILQYLGVDIDEALIRDAVDFSSFDNMKSLEKSGSQIVYKSSGFNIFATGDRTNPDAFHVRKGIVGGWRDEISAELAHKLEKRIREALPQFYGYS